MTGDDYITGDDFVAYRDGDKWGFLDADGEIVVGPTFDAVGSFSEGLARVRMGRLWGFIKPDGSYAIEPRFEQARHFSSGCAKVKQYGRWALIDAAGFWVEDVDSQTYLDDRGRFVSKEEHDAWEKPPGLDGNREEE